MIARNMASVMVCSLAVLLAQANAHAQTTTTTSTTTTTTSDFGTFASLKLKASKLKSVTISTGPSVIFTGTAQCPGLGNSQFTYDFSQESVPVNDTTQYFDGVHAAPVLDITHLRFTTTLSYSVTGNKIIQRQDWTRIKENDNGIDNQTGIRHYIGNFLEEIQVPNGQVAGVVTGETQGVMTLREPLSFSTGPLAGVATRVNVVQFIGPQASWLEPFQVSDARLCNFLADPNGTPQSVDPIYNDHCVVNGNQTIMYNGVTFTGNIVNCSQSKWGP